MRFFPRRRGVATPPDEPGMSDINVTPLTDVLLVLLIIFLVTATSADQNAFGMRMGGDGPPGPVEPSDYALVTVTALGDVFLGDVRVERPRAHLAASLSEWKRKRGTSRVVIRADSDAKYRHIVWAMDAAKQAGLPQISLATDPE